MKKLEVITTEEVFALNREEAQYLVDLLGPMNDDDKAKFLKVSREPRHPKLQFGFQLYCSLSRLLEGKEDNTL